MRYKQEMPKIPKSVTTMFALLVFCFIFLLLTPSSAEIGLDEGAESISGSGIARIATNVFDMLTEPFSLSPGGHGTDENLFSIDDEALTTGSPLENLRGILEKKPYIIEHVVEPGDTIWSIMKAYNVDEATIVNANNLTNASRLKVGQKLTFPSVTGLTHTVKKGDTISDIARTYQVTSQIILEANELTGKSTIQSGQVLVVPGGKLPKTTAKPAAQSTSTSKTSSKSPATDIAFIHPIAGGTHVTSNYGMRNGSMHNGTDFGVPTGTRVKAAAAGTVTKSGWGTGYGKLVVIDHGQGVKTYYAHNSTLLVSVGDRVEQGEAIANSGNTGRSTGPHLHFEIRIGNRTANPLTYIKK